MSEDSENELEIYEPEEKDLKINAHQFWDKLFQLTGDYDKKNYKYAGGSAYDDYDKRAGIHFEYWVKNYECKGYIQPRPEEYCVCGVHIIQQCYIHHTVSDDIIVVGNRCIDKFIGRPCMDCNVVLSLGRIDNVCKECRYIRNEKKCDNCNNTFHSKKYNICEQCRKQQKKVIKKCDICQEVHKNRKINLCNGCRKKECSVCRCLLAFDIVKQFCSLCEEEVYVHKNCVDQIKIFNCLNCRYNMCKFCNDFNTDKKECCVFCNNNVYFHSSCSNKKNFIIYSLEVLRKDYVYKNITNVNNISNLETQQYMKRKNICNELEEIVNRYEKYKKTCRSCKYQECYICKENETDIKVNCKSCDDSFFCHRKCIKNDFKCYKCSCISCFTNKNLMDIKCLICNTVHNVTTNYTKNNSNKTVHGNNNKICSNCYKNYYKESICSSCYNKECYFCSYNKDKKYLENRFCVTCHKEITVCKTCNYKDKCKKCYKSCTEEKVLLFGPHKGKTYKSVYEKHPEYIKSLLKATYVYDSTKEYILRQSWYEDEDYSDEY